MGGGGGCLSITMLSGTSAYLVCTKSRLAIRVLNYCKPRINAKRLNDVTATEARGFITCTLSGC